MIILAHKHKGKTTREYRVPHLPPPPTNHSQAGRMIRLRITYQNPDTDHDPDNLAPSFSCSLFSAPDAVHTEYRNVSLWLFLLSQFQTDHGPFDMCNPSPRPRGPRGQQNSPGPTRLAVISVVREHSRIDTMFDEPTKSPAKCRLHVNHLYSMIYR